MKHEYTPKKFRGKALSLIEKTNEFVSDYQAMDINLTLRQLYYRFIATDSFPDEWLVRLPGGQLTKNHLRNYKKLAKLVNDGRLAGYIDWSAFEDRTRELSEWQTDYSPQAALKRVIRTFKLDPWDSQKSYVEIWVEKEALESVFEPVSREYLCPLFCCRGYHSASSAYEAFQRLRRLREQDKNVTILHFGDHDPSGLDMTRDIEKRFQIFDDGSDDPYSMFSENPVSVKRCALNLNQIREFNPPPSPAKITDSRAAGYIAEFGEDSWELDALPPQELQKLAREELDMLIDHDEWARIEEEQAEAKSKFQEFGKTF